MKMFGGSSKTEKTEALRLCKARKKFIKQAIDSRYAFAAAHVSYILSLKNIGIALRRFAEAEVLVESSLSTSATENDKTPSHSSYPSPSPSRIRELSDSPLPTGSPLSTPVSRVSYMRSGGTTSAVTVRVDPSHNGYVQDEESVGFTMPPPPPPPFGEPGSWDYFDPIDDDFESFRFAGQNGVNLDFDDVGMYRQFSGIEGGLDNGHSEGSMTPELEQKGGAPADRSNRGTPVNRSNRSFTSEGIEGADGEVIKQEGERNVSGLPGTLVVRTASEPSSSKTDKSLVKKDIGAEREDPSEFITHRAKDFLSSIKDIEHRFFRASESGKEVSRMLEASKIRVGYSDAKGGSAVSDFWAALRLTCCQGNTALVSHEPELRTKVITWKRTTSSRSSSSRNPLASRSKDDNDDSGSDFAEEFCMIAGSHSSTLDRLYAWERKLYDEVKASESIRKDYDRKCDQLRHQFAKDQSAQVIDKTRAAVKDLHSRIKVALHAVDSISKRIEKMRDDELHPQLVELIQGMIRMWKAMLECHHSQYITISLAYHAKSFTGIPQGDTQREIMTQLQDEIECFGLSFADWINSHTSYVAALNGWMQNCILQPRERSTKGRGALSPRRVMGPPLFSLCQDWSAGIKLLPYEELSDSIKALLSDLRDSVEQQGKEMQKTERTVLDTSNNEESLCKDYENEKSGDNSSSNVSSVHSSLGKVLDQLTKFSEASLKMFELIRQKSETARTEHSKYMQPRR